MKTRQLIGLLVALVMFSPLAIDIYLPALPLMQQDFAVNQEQIQATLGLFLFSLGVGQIIIGPLTDHFGRRPVALAGISLYAVSALAGMLTHDFTGLLLSRIGQGIGACSTSIVAFAAVRDSFAARECARMYSYLNGALCIIPALAPTLGGLLTVQFGWRACFAFMLLFALLVLVAVWGLFAETRPASAVSSGALYRWSRYQPILRSPTFIRYALVCMAGMTGILCYVTYAPMVLVGQLGVSELEFSAWFGANALINIVAFFAAPRIVRRLGEVRTVITGLSVFALSGLFLMGSWLWWPLSAAAYMLPMTVLCSGFAVMLGSASALALMPFASCAGTASALLGCLQMSGAALLAALIQQWALEPRLAVAVSVLLPAVPLWLWCVQKGAKQQYEMITE